MTLLTGISGVPFGIDLSGVHILVAIDAALADFPEIPFFLFFMAGKTRGGHVCPVEREFGFGVLFQGIGGFGKIIHLVANDAIGTDAVIGKLPFMVVFMAIRAMLVGQRVGHFFRNMAFPAIHFHVPPF